MEHHELEQWYQRYYRWLINYHEPRYLSSPNRDQYIWHFKVKIKKFIDEFVNDQYLLGVYDLYIEGCLLKKSLPEILKQVETLRKEKILYWKIDRMTGSESEPMGFRTFMEGARPVITFLIKCKTYDLFSGLMDRLLQSHQHGTLAAQEERSLIERARHGEILLKQTIHRPPALVGFKMEVPGIAMRIDLLHKEFCKERFIDSKTTAAQIAAVFGGVPVEQPVIWKGALTQLVFFIGELVNHKLLHAPEGITYGSWLNPRLSASFIGSNGKPFTGKQISQTLHDVEKKERPPAHQKYLRELAQRIAAMNWKDSLGIDQAE